MTNLDIGAHFWSGEHADSHTQHVPVKGTALAAQTLAGTADINTYASLPTPLTYTLTLLGSRPWLCLIHLSAFVNLSTNNAELVLALDISGMTTIAAGSNPEDRLHLLAKSPIAVGLAMSDYASVNPGATVFELKYAGSAGVISDVAMDVVPLCYFPGAPSQFAAA